MFLAIRRLAIAVGLAAAMQALAACGGSGTTSSSLPSNPAGPGINPTPAPTVSIVPTPGPTSAAGTIYEYPALTTVGAAPAIMTVGSDNALWFTEPAVNKIGRLAMSGAFSDYASAVGVPFGIVTGGDGNIFYTDTTSHLAKMSTTGVNLGQENNGSTLGNVVVGPDGNLWSPEIMSHTVSQINTNPTVLNNYTLNTQKNVFITLGPDGKLWVVGQGAVFGQMSATGTAASYDLSASLTSANMGNIAAGPDGNLWACDFGDNAIVTVSTAGALIGKYTIPTPNAQCTGIASGPDGNLWFTETNGNKIGRVTVTGTFTEYPIPTAGSQPFWIVRGPDGNMWFSESAGNKIGFIKP